MKKYKVILLLIVLAIGLYCFKVFAHNTSDIDSLSGALENATPLDVIKNPKDYDVDCVDILEKDTVTQDEYDLMPACIRKIFDKLETGKYRVEGFIKDGIIQKEDIAKWHKQTSYNIGVVEYKGEKIIRDKTINYINNEIQKYD